MRLSEFERKPEAEGTPENPDLRVPKVKGESRISQAKGWSR